MLLRYSLVRVCAYVCMFVLSFLHSTLLCVRRPCYFVCILIMHDTCSFINVTAGQWHFILHYVYKCYLLDSNKSMDDRKSAGCLQQLLVLHWMHCSQSCVQSQRLARQRSRLSVWDVFLNLVDAKSRPNSHHASGYISQVHFPSHLQPWIPWRKGL